MVNAETESDRSVDMTADVPTLSQVVRALADVPINRYSFETEVIGRQAILEWHKRMIDSGRPLDLYLVEVNIKEFGDPVERQYLNLIPTTLQLPPETIERIRRAGSTLLDASPEYRRLVESLR
jgi:NTE family protein